jgi:hypothetical protein
MNSIAADVDLAMSDRVVAMRLLSHANSDTWAIYPSQELIAREVGLKPRALKYCISRLAEVGWMFRKRTNRRLTNLYIFRFERVHIIDERLRLIGEELEAERGTRTPFEKSVDVHNPAPETGMQMPSVRGTNVPRNTLSLSPEGNDLNQTGAELEVHSPVDAESRLDRPRLSNDFASQPKGSREERVTPDPTPEPFSRAGRSPKVSLDRLEAGIKAKRIRS